MSSNAISLRNVIEKWLAPTPASPIRLTRVRHAIPGPLRCVRAEALLASGPLAILFFQHGDGSWCVFPPESHRPTLGVLRGPNERSPA
ncbi:hypothetical protein B0G71_8004 [Paraburkholderia sp. BL27I4N3]|nr:hypothetical protein B0G71_8004 [Paraburkholderia sp. BL27I4N3]